MPCGWAVWGFELGGGGGCEYQLRREPSKRNLDETHDQISTCICTYGWWGGGFWEAFFAALAMRGFHHTPLLPYGFFAIITEPLFGLSTFTLLWYLVLP